MTSNQAKIESVEMDLRNGTRYELAPDNALPVDFRVKGQPEPHVGQIIDLSRGGAKIVLDTTVAINSEARIEIKTGSGTLSSRAKVCWSRPSKDAWWIGVAFETELPESEFAVLAANGFIERRRDRRVAHEADMTARWELGSDPIPVKLVDISAGGLRFFAPKPGKVGNRVLIETENNAGLSIIAKVRWQEELDGGFQVGCSFVNKNGYRSLMQQLGLGRTATLLPKLPAYSGRRLLALTLGVAVVALVGFLIANQQTAEAVGTWIWTMGR